MKRLVIFISAFIVMLCLVSCGGNNSGHVTGNDNAPCYDSIASQEFFSDYRKLHGYIKNEDFVNSRRLLDEIVSKYDFSAPTDRNVNFLILLSHTHYWNATADRIRNDEDLIEKSMELARRAYKINRDYAANIVNEFFEKDYNYRLLLKNYVE